MKGVAQLKFARRLAQKDRQLRESGQRSQEIHHRVLNDLAGLSLHQFSQWRAASQPDYCRSCISRLDATIELYRLLDSVSPGHLPIAPYLDAMAQTLQRAFAGNFQIETSLDPVVMLPRERATLVGLIFHEAISNARKYAFPDGQCGRVCATFRQVGNALELVVSDDGIGFDPTAVKQGVGTQLMRDLARQLDGTIRYRRVRKGAEFCLRFPA